MMIERHTPKPPPVFTLRFSMDEGWALVAALREYADAHPEAMRRDEWNEWALSLDKELRRA